LHSSSRSNCEGTTKKWVPFIISLLGVTADFIATTIGLSIGFHETHQQYHPLKAIAIFWTASLILTYTLPEGRKWSLAKALLATASFTGALNNALVILAT